MWVYQRVSSYTHWFRGISHDIPMHSFPILTPHVLVWIHQHCCTPLTSSHCQQQSLVGSNQCLSHCQLLEPHVLHLGFRLSISQICVKAPDRTNGVYKVRMLSVELLNCWTCWFLTRCVISFSFQSNPHHDPVFLGEITVLLVNSSCPCFDWDSPCSTAQHVGVRKTTDMGPRRWFEGKFTGKPHDLHGKIDGFGLFFSLKPIHWTIFHHF